MFIDRNLSENKLRSKERSGAGVVKLYLASAPSNGAGGVAPQIYKHVTPHGVKPTKCFHRNEVEIKRWEAIVFAVQENKKMVCYKRYAEVAQSKKFNS